MEDIQPNEVRLSRKGSVSIPPVRTTRHYDFKRNARKWWSGDHVRANRRGYSGRQFLFITPSLRINSDNINAPHHVNTAENIRINQHPAKAPSFAKVRDLGQVIQVTFILTNLVELAAEQWSWSQSNQLYTAGSRWTRQRLLSA